MKILSEYYLNLVLCVILSILLNTGKLHAQDAQIWQKYTGSITDPNIPTLPNYGYAGYKLGQEAIPETHPHLVFDVTDYGAVPNDANSDQAAIQAAIDAAEANGGGVVFFPPGEFLVNTDPNPSTSILIESSNIILKGSGSTPGGTIVNMKNRMQPPPGGGGLQPMFRFEMPWSASATSLVTQDADRGDMFVTVEAASLLQGRKYCRMDMPASLAANDQFLEGRSPQSSWTKVHDNGVSAIEYHEIESIDLANNRVYFKDPLVDDVKVAHGWGVRSIALMEGSGFEDIHFKANFFDNYVHLQHVGWGFMKMERTAHSWVRRVRISNVTGVMAVRNSYALSIIQLLVDGNRGHTTVGTVVSTRILTGLTWDNTNKGTYHGSGFATGANGS
ncbi:MAG: hypothetical protein MI975_25650, partial [Cytophagales bacterium]|nr:hypothetical protein [Cytophagales bacterium]